jgi:hypothetical protein
MEDVSLTTTLRFQVKEKAADIPRAIGQAMFNAGMPSACDPELMMEGSTR